MLDGLFGTGNGSTSSSPNIGVLGITKVTHYMFWGFFYSLFTFSVFMLPALYLKRCFKSLNWFSRWAAGV